MEQLHSEQDDDFGEENSYHLNNEDDQYWRAGAVTGRTRDNFVPFPPFTKRKEDMKIEDLVKDYALCFLPAKSLMRFRSVSKHWDHWIQNPFLAHQQSYSFQELSGYFCQVEYDFPTFVTIDRASYGVPSPSLDFLPGPINIRSSSNGLLLCQGTTENNTYFVCNPVSKKRMELPDPPCYHGPQSAVVLAFEPSVLNMEAHYQVICAVPLLDQPIVVFEMYSSQTMSWTTSCVICAELRNPSFLGDGFYMKGVAYWETSGSEVLAFDIEHEFYGIIHLPHERPLGGILAKIDNQLTYIGLSNNYLNEYNLQIYQGANLSFRRTINIQLEPGARGINAYRILPSGNSDIVMILCDNLIYSYSLGTQRVEAVTTVDGVEDQETTRFLPYVNSLVSVAYV